jgi:hypothetical protein
VLTTLCWLTVATTEHAPSGASGDSSTTSKSRGSAAKATRSHSARARASTTDGRQNRFSV